MFALIPDVRDPQFSLFFLSNTFTIILQINKHLQQLRLAQLSQSCLCNMISFIFCNSSFIMQIQLTEPRPGRVNQCTVHRKNKTSYCKNRLEFKQQAGLDFKLGFDGIQVEIATLFSLQRHKISLGFSACRMQRYVPYHIQSPFKLLANLLAEKETIVQLCYEVVQNKLQLIILGRDHLNMYLCLSVWPSKMLCVFQSPPLSHCALLI